MQRSGALLFVCAGSWLLAACAWLPFGGDAAEARPAPDTEFGVDEVEVEGVRDFYARTGEFYSLMSNRRFNAIATFQDSSLRRFFRSEQAYSDYYADLAQALADAHFERNRPLATEVVEFVFEGPGRARVTVVLKGDNGLPLRWWETILTREDRWERSSGRWWVVPGKL